MDATMIIMVGNGADGLAGLATATDKRTTIVVKTTATDNKLSGQSPTDTISMATADTAQMREVGLMVPSVQALALDRAQDGILADTGN